MRRWIPIAAIGGALAGGAWLYHRYYSPITGDVTDGFWQRALDLFGGRTVPPDSYEYSARGLQQFMFDSQVGGRFSAVDVVTPSNSALARIIGFNQFVPVQRWWPRTAALLRIANWACADIVDDANIRNHWRPEPYNTSAGGEVGSTHIDARAVDIDFDDADDRRIAEAALRDAQSRYGWMKMGLGLGPRTIHLDILSGKPQRPNIWCYEGYVCNRSVG